MNMSCHWCDTHLNKTVEMEPHEHMWRTDKEPMEGEDMVEYYSCTACGASWERYTPESAHAGERRHWKKTK
jgi:hypothetical protein